MNKYILTLNALICATTILFAQDRKTDAKSTETQYSNARHLALSGDRESAFAILHESITNGFWNMNRFKDDHEFKEQLGIAYTDSILRLFRKENAPYLQGKAVLRPIDRQTIIDLAVNGLRTYYFDTVKAEVMALEVLKMHGEGELDSLRTVSEFTRNLTDYFRKQTNDKHFYIGLNYNAVAERVPSFHVTTPAERNYGFREVSIRQGNIGYIRWDECVAGDEAYKTAQSALMLMRNTRAIIFDISANGGGNGEISTFLYHYLFRPDDKRFESLLIKRCKGETAWRRSEPPVTHLPNGPDLSEIPVYILTSDKTFSAAEYFAFVMKELGRATIIGKNTGGGGNPVTMMSSDKYMIYVPICEITTTEGKSLEGKGVAPDIEFTSDNWAKEQVEVVSNHLANNK